jgi:hypothetical protein
MEVNFEKSSKLEAGPTEGFYKKRGEAKEDIASRFGGSEPLDVGRF